MVQYGVLYLDDSLLRTVPVCNVSIIDIFYTNCRRNTLLFCTTVDVSDDVNLKFMLETELSLPFPVILFHLILQFRPMLLLLQILLVALVLKSDATDSSSQHHHQEKQRKRSLRNSTFPKVYTTNLMLDDLKNAQEIISEMDLLHVDCSSETCQVFTLIHSSVELDYLQGLVPLSYDRNSTEAILAPTRRRQLNSDVGVPSYSSIPEFDCYLDLQGMQDWLQEFMDFAPPHLSVELIDIGDSYLKTLDEKEGHDIFALKMTSATSTILNKAPLMILSGVHAREYAPPELVRQWLHEFLDADNLELQTILETTEIHWIPYVNPDGRYLAETSEKFRRKNLNKEARGSNECQGDEFGVDLNRNFPFRWGLNSGSSMQACMQTYRGESAGSEPETQAVVAYVQRVFPESQRKETDDFAFDNVKPYDEETTSGVFLDIHAFGNYYIYVRTAFLHPSIFTLKRIVSADFFFVLFLAALGI